MGGGTPVVVLITTTIGCGLHDYPARTALTGGFSILNLLVVVAGFFLLITGEYPPGLFRFILGINRWIYLVVIYVAFMRDEYPPFRLDQGEVGPQRMQFTGENTAPTDGLLLAGK